MVSTQYVGLESSLLDGRQREGPRALLGFLGDRGIHTSGLDILVLKGARISIRLLSSPSVPSRPVLARPETGLDVLGISGPAASLAAGLIVAGLAVVAGLLPLLSAPHIGASGRST